MNLKIATDSVLTFVIRRDFSLPPPLHHRDDDDREAADSLVGSGKEHGERSKQPDVDYHFKISAPFLEFLAKMIDRFVQSARNIIDSKLF